MSDFDVRMSFTCLISGYLLSNFIKNKAIFKITNLTYELTFVCYNTNNEVENNQQKSRDESHKNYYYYYYLYKHMWSSLFRFINYNINKQTNIFDLQIFDYLEKLQKAQN